VIPQTRHHQCPDGSSPELYVAEVKGDHHHIEEVIAHAVVPEVVAGLIAFLVSEPPRLPCPFMKVRRPHSRDLLLIGLGGLAGMTACLLLLNTGERVVPAGTASLLVATAPV
jgi:drug/metabolite transporter (DMT)-like permease